MTIEALPHQKYILLADDNVNLRRAIEEYLNHIGFHVITAGDGKKALDLFTQHRGKICSIITDIFMPMLDGVSLLRQIRQSDRDIPMMAITGGAHHTIQGTLDQLGVPLFCKPLSFHALEEHLTSVLRPASCAESSSIQA